MWYRRHQPRRLRARQWYYTTSPPCSSVRVCVMWCVSVGRRICPSDMSEGQRRVIPSVSRATVPRTCPRSRRKERPRRNPHRTAGTPTSSTVRAGPDANLDAEPVVWRMNNGHYNVHYNENVVVVEMSKCGDVVLSLRGPIGHGRQTASTTFSGPDVTLDGRSG